MEGRQLPDLPRLLRDWHVRTGAQNLREGAPSPGAIYSYMLDTCVSKINIKSYYVVLTSVWLPQLLYLVLQGISLSCTDIIP